MNNPKLSLCMIVKNEETFLADCLRSVEGVVDEIIIVDTGSTDNTVEIARSFNAKIYEYAWHDDFAAARNFGIEKASGEWILQLDADEELFAKDKPVILDAIQHPTYLAFAFQIVDLAVSETFIRPRLFRNHLGFKYAGKIHETLDLRYDTYDQSCFAVSSVRIKHKGYTPDMMTSRNKFDRNITLLQEAHQQDPESPNVNFHLAHHYMSTGELEKAIELFRLILDSPAKSQYGSAYKYLLMCYMLQRKYKEALEVAQAGIREFPDYNDLIFHEGVIRFFLKDYRGAEEAFAKSIRTKAALNSPTSTPGSSGNLAKLFFLLSRYEQDKNDRYLKEIDNIMASISKDKDALFYLGKLFITVYGPDKAREEFKRIADTSIDDVKGIYTDLFGI